MSVETELALPSRMTHLPRGAAAGIMPSSRCRRNSDHLGAETSLMKLTLREGRLTLAWIRW